MRFTEYLNTTRLMHHNMPNEQIYVDFLLPQYTVTQPKEGALHCVSHIGISNENEWEKFKNKVIVYLNKNGKRLQEFYHETCYNHKDFRIYYTTLKPNKP